MRVPAPGFPALDVRVALALLLLAALGCGTGTNGKPVAPPTTPEPPVPPPPSEPHTVSAEVSVRSAPLAEGGYSTYERIVLIARFEHRTTVVGSPRLAVDIGAHRRLADFSPWVEDEWPPERPSWLQRFEYEVAANDQDADGISVPEDAFDLTEGTLLTEAGVEVRVEISAVSPQHPPGNPVAPDEPLDSHRVVRAPEPRVCTEVVLIGEWDGTPFRFYFDEGIPASERADAEHFFGVVERLSERIEGQIGYSILEVAGWISEAERGFTIGYEDVEDCVGVRPGGIVATVIPNEERYAAARAYCGVVYWTNNDIDSWDSTLPHEVFHLFGFGHSLITHPQEAWQGGIPMSVRLTTSPAGPTDLGVTFDDVDALRCIFPEGG